MPNDDDPREPHAGPASWRELAPEAWRACVQEQLARGVALEPLVTALGRVRHDARATVVATHAGDEPALLSALAELDRWFEHAIAIAIRTHAALADERDRRNERLVNVGLVAAGIAHELRNPLSVIESSTFILRKVVDGERAHRHVDTIAKQVTDCNRIVSALLELTRAGPVERRPVRPEDVFAGALGQAVVPPEVEVRVEIDDGLVVHASGGLLAQAIANLVMNAVRTLGPRPGTVRLSAHRRDGGVELVVADDGPGFDPVILPRAFEPLVTGEVAGIGLGLALVRNIAERHGGRVSAENAASGGAIVRLFVPNGERA